MSKAIFTLEDEDNGLTNMQVQFVDGLSPDSGAHKTAQMLITLMGKIHGEQNDAVIEGREPMPLERLLSVKVPQD